MQIMWLYCILPRVLSSHSRSRIYGKWWREETDRSDFWVVMKQNCCWCRKLFAQRQRTQQWVLLIIPQPPVECRTKEVQTVSHNEGTMRNLTKFNALESVCCNKTLQFVSRSWAEDGMGNGELDLFTFLPWKDLEVRGRNDATIMHYGCEFIQDLRFKWFFCGPDQKPKCTGYCCL